MTAPPTKPRPTLPVLAACLITLLAGCGFDLATNRVNTLSAGVNNREGVVDVLGAVIVANQDDVGTFAATFVNNDREAPAALESLNLEDQSAVAVPPGPNSRIPAGGLLNLFGTGGVELRGAFTAGDFVTVTAQFDTGQRTSVMVNVLPPCDQYAPTRIPGLDLPSPPESGTGADAATDLEPAEVGSAVEDPNDGTDRNDLPGRYSCDRPAPLDLHEELDSSGDGAEPEPEELTP